MNNRGRNYFDYKLAYEGYKKAVDLFNKGGIEEVVNNEDFDISCGGVDVDIDFWTGYIPINASGYNITLFANDKNFDTDNKEHEWYISGEVDIYSYGYYEDNLYINDIETIKDRIINLRTWAKEHDYSENDYNIEMKSLLDVLEELEKEKTYLLDSDSYIIFVLRDLLKNFLPSENDLAYKFCVKIAKDFKASEYNTNEQGIYSCLERYVEDKYYKRGV